MDGIVLFIFWVVFGAVAALIAKGKNRDQTLWFILGILGGIITVIVISLLPPV